MQQRDTTDLARELYCTHSRVKFDCYPPPCIIVSTLESSQKWVGVK